MKYIIFSLLLSVSSAFAGSLCEMKDTYEFSDKVLSKSAGENFTATERQMIFSTMKTYGKGFRTYENEYKALWDFQDKYEECSPEVIVPGPNAGEIVYYQLNGKKIALVHFFPGENEYGSIFEVSPTGKFTFLAKINDGEIYCK